MANQHPYVELTRIEKFSACHRLHNNLLTAKENKDIYGKCNNPNGHGHNYTWEITLRGPIDPRTGMVYNLSELKNEMNEVLDLVDHKNLDLDVPYFTDNVSTTENLVVYLWSELKCRMKNPSLLYKSVLHETDKNIFAYQG
ncbi:unnamed protein product [Dracunculus medinensis]|uniref:6-pyruvoyl tetrahydrobiopterin synthase n=1 Tax=Dracunculus medinensis TaxID=318479 RepID=A0A0N4U130_DRAME|nr:unnamed protein product [Dracunculus medinensis]